MGPLWAEIIQDNIAPVFRHQRDPKVKFALYSGHDSTLMPLLAEISEEVSLLWLKKHLPKKKKSTRTSLGMWNWQSFF